MGRRTIAPNGGDVVPGRRAVLEALRSQRPLRKVLLSRRIRRSAIIGEIVQMARSRDILIQVVDGRRLDELVPATHHQGVVALTSATALASVEEILAVAQSRREPPLVVVLDGVEDPANLGAIIRTAEGAGAHGLIIPKHRAVGLTATVAKTSAGALEYLPVAQVTNIARTLGALKDAGLWVVGADPDASEIHHRVRLKPPLAMVIGAEGRGLGRLVREQCDLLVRLPMRGKISSLNVAVAAGVLLYEVVRQQEGEGAARSPISKPDI